MKNRYVREIISGFPYPVVSFFIRLRTDECLDPGPLRLKYILSTAEAVSRFLGAVSLCECREYLENHSTQPPQSVTADFGKQFSRPSWGIWLHFTRESLKWLHERGADPTMTEMTDFFFRKIPKKESAAASALGELLSIRNALSHEKIRAMSNRDYRELCEKTFPLLEQVLESLEFLLDYELTFVSQIEVSKQRKIPPTFLHRLSKLIGESDSFPGDRKTLDSFMDSGAVLLMNMDNGRSVNLDPFLVYESGAGKAPDIFFYNGMKKPEAAEYSACKHGGSFVSKDSERAEIIAGEIRNLMRLFTPPSEPEEGNNG